MPDDEIGPNRLSLLPLPQGGRHAFVDLHNDVTAADIALAAREGFIASEHVKRYTTLGMGTDQGKTGNVAGLALLAAMTGRDIGETAPTTFRPPYVPVAFGLLAGRARGRLAEPVRVTPMHEWHVAAGAVFEDVGQWKRAALLPAARRGHGCGGAARMPRGARRRRPARRLYLGEDRGVRARCRALSRPHLHQSLAESRGRAAAATA